MVLKLYYIDNINNILCLYFFSFNIIELPNEQNQQLKESFKCLKKIILGKLNYSWYEVMSLCEAFPLLEVLEVFFTETIDN